MDKPSAAQRRPLAIIVVTFQSAEVVHDCLLSIATAAVDFDHRVIVVDNASSDDTVAVVAATMSGVEIIRRPSNDGFAAGVNCGVATAPNCDVLVLNADVRLRPDTISSLIRGSAAGCGIRVPRLVDATGRTVPSLRRRPTLARAAGEALVGGRLGGWCPLLGELMLSPRTYERPTTADWATGAAWLVSRECLDALGPLDERYFLYSEETEYMLRAADHGFAVRYEPAAVAVHLGGEQSSSPTLWALSVCNKVRLHRERQGATAAVLYWIAVMANELVRASVRSADRRRHVMAIRSLLMWRRWPDVERLSGRCPASQPAYVAFTAQDWWYHNRSHSDFQLMQRVAEQRKVLIVNSIGMRLPIPGRSKQVARKVFRKLGSIARFVRRPDPELLNLYVMSPVPLPLYGSRAGRLANALLVRAQVGLVCAVLGIKTPVIVVTLPTAWDVAKSLRRRSLVYNRSDHHSKFEECNEAVIASLEQDLLAHADHVLYASGALLSEERSVTGDRGRYLDHGVDLDHFDPGRDLAVPDEVSKIPRPWIGFFGALDDQVVDFALLERLAVEIPEASLMLVGDASRSMAALTRHRNVHWLGFRAYEDIPNYAKGFNVAIMPWLRSDWIQHCNPIKMKEYLALGLPVVSTSFPEVERYVDVIRIAEDHDRFIDMVRLTLEDGGLQAPHDRRSVVDRSSWRDRAAELIGVAESPGAVSAVSRGSEADR